MTASEHTIPLDLAPRAESVESQLSTTQRDWLRSALEQRGAQYLTAFVGAGRHLGTETHRVGPSGLRDSSSHSARVLLTIHYAEVSGESALEWIVRAYREGDSREKAAIVSCLPLLPCSKDGQPFRVLALDCGRTNEAELFRRLAIGNSFPHTYYSDDEFNQLVMKAAFSDLDLGGVIGLEDRCNPELARMGMEYIDERLSAGRSYPPSLWLAIAPCNPKGASARMSGELQHSRGNRRYYAAKAMGQCGDLRALPFLVERRAMEDDSKVQGEIENSILRLKDLHE